MASVRLTMAPLVLCALLVAGCAEPKPAQDPGTPAVAAVAGGTLVANLLNLTGQPAMTFEQRVVTPAVGTAQDLYEPTMEISDTGTFYVAAHVIGAATTGTPTYFSRDEGKSWKQLPLLGPAAAPSPIQGATPPPGDEGFLVAGDGGRAWMSDIYAAGYSITGWCDDGASECYDNRYAYDRVESTTTTCGDGALPGGTAGSLNDRPWIAHANSTLLLVNNPGGGPMQIGVLHVPPAFPVGLFDPITGPQWNLCASPDGYIPGVPAMRPDGFFAVPQIAGQGTDQERLTLVTGNAADINAVLVHDVFLVTSASAPGGGTTNGGRTAFGKDGTLFVGAYNNSDADVKGKDAGHFVIAASLDDAASFTNVTFTTTSPMQSLYLDSNLFGPGVLLTWSQVGSKPGRADWYVAHLSAGPKGEPVLSDVNLAVDEGPPYAAHVMGAAVGPDGRAAFVTFEDPGIPGYVGSTPISVWLQTAGPTLPH